MELLYKSIPFAKEITPISDEELGIAIQSRKTLLFHRQETWIKIVGDVEFDIPMGCFDGAEVCEIVGCHLLNELSNIVDKELVEYRDDGIGVYKIFQLHKQNLRGKLL